MRATRDPRQGHHEGYNASRRRFLRRGIGLGAGTILGSLAGCAGGGDALDDVADDTAGQTAAEPELALQGGLEIGLGSTTLAGLAGPATVDPDEPGGGQLVTIDAATPGAEVTFSWRRTIERELTPDTTETAGVGEETPTPETEVVEQSGTIRATGLDDAHRPLLPMYWDTGEVTTETSAIWLSSEAFTELRDTRETAWSKDVLTRISRLSEEAVEQIEDGVQEVEEVTLQAESEFVDMDLAVNGEEQRVQAIAAFDTFGNAYRILNNESNPLILKFTYDAVSTGFAGIDAGLWSLIKTVFSGYQVVSLDHG